ncbi:hypothetical protein BJ508DRAFT_118097 [Ascobolus immersus RN42]|uniref:Prion-inhibition and propagation HeLo domain-containing protein n=1 Tax=Ascobolus immersus RN42 TaxID=1160509 RepID=A0A3N4IH76_ASCIM|nr:hypothetical protein BJ508DRAFT_118097 [Ascobolus immersus RN42]
MSGFEIAGVVIGVLPLLLDAGKASSRHFQYVKQARNATKADAVLYEFYLEVFYEMFMLKKTLESVFSRLPGVSTEKKNRIVACEYDEWCRDPEVVRSLQTVFKQDDLDTFIMAMERLLEIFFRLVEEKTSKLSKDEKVRTENIPLLLC